MKRGEAELRNALAAGKIGPLKPDAKEAPPGWITNLTHLTYCTSCFQEEHLQSVHKRSPDEREIASPGKYEIVGIDDHALAYWHNIIRTMETPKKQVTDLQCPGVRCEVGDSKHALQNHFGMYGTVLYEENTFKIWLGEWVPYFATSEDGIRWSTLRPLGPWTNYTSKDSQPDSSARRPRNLCITKDAPPLSVV